MRRFLIFYCCILLGAVVSAQNPEKPRLIAGPFAGSVTKNSAKIWIAFRGDGQNMVTLQDTVEKTKFFPTGFHTLNDHKGNTSMVTDFTGLKPEHVYKVQFALPQLLPHPKCFIKTLADTTVKDVAFLFGSCALLNTDITRIAFPGFKDIIFTRMKKQRAAFMVWLGDNLYYFHKHYTSYQGMFNRNLAVRRQFPMLSDFLAEQPNYSIWDDHDYGWNDSDRKFPLKDSSIIIYKGFWPNPYPEKQAFQGNYFTFRNYDAEFFMTDDRWYRDNSGDTAGPFLGNEQLNWLENELQKSDATFKFICVGSQVLNDSHYGETYAKNPVERNELFDFIASKNIKGVIFLTGDKHYSELCKRNWKGYPIYDFTSSPITSPISPGKLLGLYRNPYTVKGSILFKHNFGKITLTGPAGKRVCKLEIYGQGGQKKWSYRIDQEELQINGKANPGDSVQP